MEALKQKPTHHALAFPNLKGQDEDLAWHGWSLYPKLPTPPSFFHMNDHIADTRDIWKYAFTGALVNINFLTNENFILTHTFKMNRASDHHATQNSGVYALGANYNRGKLDMSAKYGVNTNETTTDIVYDGELVSFDFSGKFTPFAEESNFHLAAQLKLEDSVLEFQSNSLEIGNNYIGVGYTQTMNRDTTLGTSYGFVYGEDMGSTQEVLEFVLKNENKSHIVSSSLSLLDSQAHLNSAYTKKLAPNLNAVVMADLVNEDDEWVSDWKFGWTATSVGGGSLKTVIHSHGLSSVINMQLQDGIQALFSTKIDYFENIYDIGFGVNIFM
eukprot:TRINITY_DN9740_c0_g1_i1.p1 TRINITY_DN9740_c0_g1~~TRINITY_DN9740_c0_g1_i1.p1  ORF type:complete len:328 (-),score=84.29 TRINITY_DN9740_c0_g1_i1:91-1074(-)